MKEFVFITIFIFNSTILFSQLKLSEKCEFSFNELALMSIKEPLYFHNYKCSTIIFNKENINIKDKSSKKQGKFLYRIMATNEIKNTRKFLVNFDVFKNDTLQEKICFYCDSFGNCDTSSIEFGYNKSPQVIFKTEYLDSVKSESVYIYDSKMGFNYKIYSNISKNIKTNEIVQVSNMTSNNYFIGTNYFKLDNNPSLEIIVTRELNDYILKLNYLNGDKSIFTIEKNKVINIDCYNKHLHRIICNKEFDLKLFLESNFIYTILI